MHTPIIQEGPPIGHARAGASPQRVVKRRANDGSSFLRLSVDRLVTLLGIDESLASRSFDKTMIFGHWLSKTRKLALAFGDFLLKNASTISIEISFLVWGMNPGSLGTHGSSKIQVLRPLPFLWNIPLLITFLHSKIL